MRTNAFVLLVDDNDELRNILAECLANDHYHVKALSRAFDAEEALQETRFDMAVFDMRLPDGNGLELIKKARASNPDMGIIMITGFAEMDLAIDAVRLGADDFMKKPFNPDELQVRLQEVLNKRQVYRKYEELVCEKHSEQHSEAMIGHCPAMDKIRDTIKMLSSSDSTVLITGETGTGKEVVAKMIHYAGTRAQYPFVSINCGAIPEELLESELFGHVKGAFTGAIKGRVGRFEVAHKGTIFLDEIGDMSPNLQVKILRVLQERCFEPVGSNDSVEVDVRVIAATHRNFETMVERGEFREDLYYRLNVIPIHLPPLRERDDDVLQLARHFIQHHCQKNNILPLKMSKEVSHRFMTYAWPGNVRELQNVIERIVTFNSSGVIGLDDLPEKMLSDIDRIDRDFSVSAEEDFPIDLKAMVDEYENSLILSALARANGNKSQAAELLSIKRTTLVEKMKKKALGQRT